MAIKGIIFDLDGTLVNTIEDIGDSMNRVLKEEGRDEFSYDEYKIKVGGGFKNLVLECYGEADDEKFDQILNRLEEIYDENYLNKSKAYEGIHKLLDSLMKRNIKLAVNTNKNQDYSEKMMKEIFPNIDFIKIIGKSEEIPAKPDTTGLEIILKEMNLKKEELLYIGDSNVDMMTGKNAGIKTVGVDWGFRGEKELKEYGADYIVYEALEILEIIDR